jgi:hypothetical protein
MIISCRLEILPQRRSLGTMRGSKAVIERPDLRGAGPFGQILKREPRRPGSPSFAAGPNKNKMNRSIIAIG